MGAMAAFTFAVNASAAKTKIADVSQYQGNINWSKASKQLKFAIIRVQHGDTGDADFRIDTHKNINANGAYKYKVPFGQYGYAEFSSVADAKREAKDFYKRSSSKARFYVLDNEHRKGKGSEQSYVNAWLAQMRKLTNKPLVYYSYQTTSTFTKSTIPSLMDHGLQIIPLNQTFQPTFGNILQKVD